MKPEIEVAEKVQHYEKSFLADNRVLCYRFNDILTGAVDDWADDMSNELLNWPADKTWRMLLDVRVNGGVVGSHGLSRARELSKLRPELKGRLAVLINSTIGAQVISTAMRATSNENRKRMVFASQRTAMAWLLEDK